MRGTAARCERLVRCGYDPARVVLLRQEHTRRVVAADDVLASTADQDPEDRVAADGIVAGPEGPALAVGVGDCMPILLYDRVTGARGLLHSGWKGTGILEAAVRELEQRYRVRASGLVAHFGPCISSDAYVVDDARAAEYAEWGTSAVVYRENRPYLDLRAANLAIARRLGIGQVSYADHCTFADERLGSFRRQGAGYTGMLVVVGERNEGFQNRDT
jgi:YfiH family protein